jgi:hypothetical protein
MLFLGSGRRCPRRRKPFSRLFVERVEGGGGEFFLCGLLESDMIINESENIF